MRRLWVFCLSLITSSCLLLAPIWVHALAETDPDFLASNPVNTLTSAENTTKEQAAITALSQAETALAAAAEAKANAAAIVAAKDAKYISSTTQNYITQINQNYDNAVADYERALSAKQKAVKRAARRVHYSYRSRLSAVQTKRDITQSAKTATLLRQGNANTKYSSAIASSEVGTVADIYAECLVEQTAAETQLNSALAAKAEVDNLANLPSRSESEIQTLATNLSSLQADLSQDVTDAQTAYDAVEAKCESIKNRRDSLTPSAGTVLNNFYGFADREYGKTLNLYNANAIAGGDIVTHDLGTHRDQVWTLTPVSGSGGYTQIRNTAYNMCIGYSSASASKPVSVNCSNGSSIDANQQWQLLHVATVSSTNYYLLKNRGSGKCIADTSSTIRIPLALETCNTSNYAQQWKIVGRTPALQTTLGMPSLSGSGTNCATGNNTDGVTLTQQSVCGAGTVLRQVDMRQSFTLTADLDFGSNASSSSGDGIEFRILSNYGHRMGPYWARIWARTYGGWGIYTSWYINGTNTAGPADRFDARTVFNTNTYLPFMVTWDASTKILKYSFKTKNGDYKQGSLDMTGADFIGKHAWVGFFAHIGAAYNTHRVKNIAVTSGVTALPSATPAPSISNVSLAGDASDMGGNLYRLTPNSSNQAGAVWMAVDTTKDVVLDGRINFYGPLTGDGMGIGLQCVGANYVGYYKGWSGISHTVSGQVGYGFLMNPYINFNKVVAVDGQAQSHPSNYATIVSDFRSTFQLTDGDVLTTQFKWEPSLNRMSLTLDANGYNHTYTYTFTSNIPPKQSSGCYVGYTAGTGSAYQEQRVRLVDVSNQ